LDVIETLQGAPLTASILETEILPARINGYNPGDLDKLISAGEIAWVGFERLGNHDGRIGLYLAEKLPLLWTPRMTPGDIALDQRESRIIEYLRTNGASFFQSLHDGVGGGYPGETLDALWSLVWRGLLTNDAFHALRSYCERPSGRSRNSTSTRRIHSQREFRSRRTTPPTAQGRWSLNAIAFDHARNGSKRETQWSHGIALQLLARYGIVFRETANVENVPGGFSAIYEVMKAFEQSGRVRRGYFVADLGATQFALPPAVELLRSLRTTEPAALSEAVILSATDPANPYGAILRWPISPESVSSLTRSVGARVVLIDGALLAYLRRANPSIQVLLPDEEPTRSQMARILTETLVKAVKRDIEAGELRERGGMLISHVNGIEVRKHPIATFLLDAGFRASPRGFNLQRTATAVQRISTTELQPDDNENL
jgi:ATP-dependent Lhr-like helicase